MNSPQKPSPFSQAKSDFNNHVRLANDAIWRATVGFDAHNWDYLQANLKMARKYLRLASYHADLFELLQVEIAEEPIQP